MHSIGFDTDRYLEEQKKRILERVSRFEKLYLEFGGKLCYDYHAARTMPGYRPSAKIELLKQLGDVELIYCVSAKHLEKGKIRADFGLTYDNQTLKDIGDIKDFGLNVSSVVITLFNNESTALMLKKKLENFGMKVYLHKPIEGYPHNIPKVLEGYSNQQYIETTKKIVIITGAGPNSGKMATCLSQIYQERKKGANTAFAKFETFPIWNLDLNHPINIAYEASTADLKDVNMVDPFHKLAYDITSINYNRDIENFNILINIMKGITGEEHPFGYKSPTDMGVNSASAGIIDDKICREAAVQEIIRRYFRYTREKIQGTETQETIDQINMIMQKVNAKPEDRAVAKAAQEAALEAKEKGKGFENIFCGAAIQLKDGKIVSGKNSPFLHAESAAMLNAVKEISKIPDEIDLISPEIIKYITEMKKNLLNKKASCLDVNETLIALAISSATNPTAKLALKNLNKLENCEMHITHLPKEGDESGIRRLKINLTTDAKISSLPYFQ